MMTLAFYIAKAFATGIPQRKCISLECGLQNGTLAVFVATQIFNDAAYMVPTAAYALVMYIYIHHQCISSCWYHISSIIKYLCSNKNS